MMVTCNKLLAPVGGGTLDWSPWLTVGSAYPVVSVLAQPDGAIDLRIVDDKGSLGLFESSAFTTTDGTIPSNWVARISGNGLLECAPARWLVPGFWEDYYDGDPTAAKVVAEELTQILSQSAG